MFYDIFIFFYKEMSFIYKWIFAYFATKSAFLTGNKKAAPDSQGR
jgi:hypothetical protein